MKIFTSTQPIRKIIYLCRKYFGNKIIFVFFSLLITLNLIEALTASEFIEVKNGFVKENGILAEEKGKVFLEFLKNTYVSQNSDRQPYTGNILPPSIIDAPIKKPRIRTREILTFELLSDTIEPLNFVDKYFLLHPKEHLRAILNAEENLTRSGGVKILMAIKDEEKWGLPQLWVLKKKAVKEKGQIKEVQYWDKIGGKIIEDSKIKLFSAVINQTGTFMLLDEDPPPFYHASDPLETVELVEQSPFPSVTDRDISDQSQDQDTNQDQNTNHQNSQDQTSNLGANINQSHDNTIPDFLADDFADDSNFSEDPIFPEDNNLTEISNGNQLSNANFSNETQLDIIPAIEPLNSNKSNLKKSDSATNQNPLDNIGQVIPNIGGLNSEAQDNLLSPLPLNQNNNQQSTTQDINTTNDNNFAQNLGANFLGNDSINQDAQNSIETNSNPEKEKKIPIGLLLAFFVLGGGTYYAFRG